MKDDSGRAEKGGGQEVNRVAIKRELRAMFAQVEVSLSAELLADRRRAAGDEADPVRPDVPDRIGSS
jgi:hypothetical protein